MASRFPQLHSFCFCCSLETGAKCIGFFELIGDAALFLFGIISTFRLVNEDIRTEHEAAYRDVLLTASVYVDLSLLFELIFAIYLLYGIYKGKQNYIKVWLVVQTVFLIISVFGVIIMTILRLMIDNAEFNIIEETIALFVHCYFLLVVYSYYRSVKGDNILLPEL
ncbi:hypothetical protein O3M35_011742 [Rhynocoris fuscipes]|uniref:Uncharacterized protein n=1 Tax=Rhynocoris fuscipes TaxID=488301 RepID=A0AAW1CG62_9HEMI